MSEPCAASGIHQQSGNDTIGTKRARSDVGPVATLRLIVRWLKHLSLEDVLGLTADDVLLTEPMGDEWCMLRPAYRRRIPIPRELIDDTIAFTEALPVERSAHHYADDRIFRTSDGEPYRVAPVMEVLLGLLSVA